MSEKTKQTTGLCRNTKDKYYTSSKIAKDCVEAVKKYVHIHENDLAIEPSAGHGAFIPFIKDTFENYKFYDIDPNNDEIEKANFLEIDFLTTHLTNNIHIVGNPPFGRQSSLAIQFIKKCCQNTNCRSISFILPKSFKKESMKKCFSSYFHLDFQMDIPSFSFIVENKPHDVPCVFQIWNRKDVPRLIPEKLLPRGFSFVKIENNPDISFRRVGVYAGKIDRNYESKSIQSHYFIKFSFPLTDQIYDKIISIDYPSKQDTVGPRSISKQEVITQFNLVLQNY